ncbi:hypothetical protein PMAYCL1PPCAC_09498, partial [Pristionchus mayeri]
GDVDSRRIFKCDECGKGFTAKKTLVEHRLVHTNKKRKKNACDICGKSYNSFTSMKEHRWSHEEDVEARLPLKCDKCYKRFGYLMEKWKCEECGKSFTSGSNLKAHKKRIHTSPKNNSTKRQTLEKGRSDVSGEHESLGEWSEEESDWESEEDVE